MVCVTSLIGNVPKEKKELYAYAVDWCAILD